jgi:hypothetical protein
MRNGSCHRTNLAGFAARCAVRTAGGQNRPVPPTVEANHLREGF